MKYAVLNGERIEPQKGIKNAICPICGEIVIPKCGSKMVHHWAHKSTQNCDLWWESETDWHRKWKDNFPKECQEVIMHDNETGEKHVADIKTQTGIVLEFQHSPMSIEEQQSREQFYKNMIWVVDARKHYDKFKQYINRLNHCKSNKNYFYQKIDFFEKQSSCFSPRWLDSSVPVIFDFGIHDSLENNDFNKQKKWLWCIFPEKYTKNLGYYSFDKALCGLYIRKDNFIKRVIKYSDFYPNIVLSELEELRIKIEKEREKQEIKYQEKIQKQEELYKKHQEELFKTKYPKEEKWRDAISNIKLDIENNNLKPKRLDISKNGEIHDKDKHIYNGKKCMILGIKSNNYALILIKNDDKFIITTIYIPSSILYDYYSGFELLYGNYNYFIRTTSVIPNYEKYSIWFEDDERIWTTEKLKKDLDFIRNNFK